MGDLASEWSQGETTISQDNAPHKAVLTKEKTQGLYFGIEHRENRVVPKLCMILRTGRTVYLPYSHQPVIDFTPERDLRIVTPQARITVTGRGLKALMDHLFEDKLRWIKEADCRMDDGTEPVFISSISVEGKIFH